VPARGLEKCFYQNNMFRFVVFACAVAACAGQLVDEPAAKILKEQRFNAGDGRTGAAFATENEIRFREESTEDGERIGQYSFIGADGQTYTVKYSAGKEGFRILEGDHIPSGGQNAAAFVSEEPQFREPIAPVQPAAPVQEVQEAQPAFDYVEYDYEEEAPVDPNFNPFINPHDPTHRNFAFNKNGAKFAPKVPGVLDSSNVPNCAGCEGLNPFINPFDASHQRPVAPQAGLLAGHLAGHRAGAQQPRRQPAAPRQPAALPTIVRTTTTPAPKRFFPPGKLALNRFETGFNFDFSS